MVRAYHEIGFVEKFALAADRDAVLRELAPGTEEFFFYHALHYQNSRQAEKLKATLDQWRREFPDSAQRKVIETRSALAEYDTNPQATLSYIRRILELRFDHQPAARNRKPNLPSELNPDVIARNVFLARALLDDSLSGLSLPEMERLVADRVPLRSSQVAVVLQRLEYPDIPNLAEFIAADLKREDGPSFGTHAIHGKLLPAQLDRLAQLVPDLAEDTAFVNARLRRLAPNADEDEEFDPAVRLAWLERLWGYAKGLPAGYNSLKAAILYHRLDHDRKQGVYDQKRFLEYLGYPRQTNYIARPWLNRLERGETEWVDFSESFSEARLPFPPISDDEALVRDYFLHLLAQKAVKPSEWKSALSPYTEWVQSDWLRPILAEAMICSGKDKPEAWSAFLSASEFQALKDRVDIEFALENKPFFTPADGVTVDVHLKKVPKLIVRTYEINTLSYYLQNQKQLNTDLNLDGLVANTEATHNYAETPFQKTRRSFSFPELQGKRGAWMIEFIGGGRSSRVLIRKGQWHLAQQTGPAGDMLTVLDENHQPVKDAAVWLDGRRFGFEEKANAILVPFTAHPSRRPIVISSADGSFATLTDFDHHGEDYKLHAQFFLDREQLLAGREATLAVRADLYTGNAPLPLALLKDTTLTIVMTTQDGVTATEEIKDVTLDPKLLYTKTFKVPDRLATIRAVLNAQVAQFGKNGEKAEVSEEEDWTPNSGDKTDLTHAGHFTKFGDSYVYELLGRNGEPIPDKQVMFAISRKGFTQPVITVALRTDEKGRVQLGILEGISNVHASGEKLLPVLLEPVQNQRLWPEQLHAAREDVIEIPLVKPFAAGRYTLLEKRDEDFVADRSGQIAEPKAGCGAITLSGLTPGDYVLRAKDSDEDVTIRVTKGTALAGWLYGGKRYLKRQGLHPLHIVSAGMEGEDLSVRLANANEFARVQVVARRFLPRYSLFDDLSPFPRVGAGTQTPAQLPNLYSGGREIGDEYRYILDRRFTKRYPGNMLARPGLLLNPWELRETGQNAVEQKQGQAAGMTRGGRGGEAEAAQIAVAAKRKAALGLGDDNFSSLDPNFDFLAEAAPVILNLMPGKDGVVKVPRKSLGDRQIIEVYASDLTQAMQVNLALSEMPTRLADVRLNRPLDPAKPFAEKRLTTVLTADKKLTIEDLRSSEIESFSTIADAFGLYKALNQSAELAKFSWILKWPDLKPEEKRAKYSEFACHELNIFLSRKDPEFFKTVIKPYLANKKERTFLDDYLLEADLSSYLEPWKYGQLNAAERALLGRRLSDETAKTARHLKELWELIPPNDAKAERLFETALHGRVRGAGEGKNGGLGDLAAKDQQRARMLKEVNGAWEDQVPKGFVSGGARGGAPTDPFSTSEGTAAPAAAPKPMAVAAVADSAPAPALPATPATAGSVVLSGVMTYSGGGFIDANQPMITATADELGKLMEAVRPYYLKLGPVKERAENQYWHLALAAQGPDLITVNAFWRDYAAWDGKGAFLSPNLAEAHRNFSEIMIALAVLDLPFKAGEMKTDLAEAKLTVTATTPLVVFHKEILPAAAPNKEQVATPALLVSQSFFRSDDRYRMEGNLKFEKPVSKEFLTGVVYGANVAVTNPTSAPADFDLLWQIPQGSIAVSGGKPTKSQHLVLQPYTTQSFEYFFYFPQVPAEGTKFVHYPVTAAGRGKDATVTLAPAFTFNVVNQLNEEDKASWEYISQYASAAEVMTYLEQNNIERCDLARVAWRCRESVDFFRQITALMRSRHVYEPVIYSYGAHHNDPVVLAEYLRHRQDFLNLCGGSLDTKLVKLDLNERRQYEQLEYSPLVNQRIHQIGGERRIVTPEELAQYQRFLGILSCKPSLSSMDSLTTAYYLLLQDRVEEGLAFLGKVTAADLPTKLQYDYLRSYAAFYEGRLADARGAASPYADHPVERWKTLFGEVLSQLDEIEGKAGKGGDKPDREKAQAELAATEPSFDFKVENQSLVISARNLKELTVNYYLMDPEFAFSSNPFTSEGSSRFSIIKPNRSAKLTLPAEDAPFKAPLPSEYARANVLIEVLGAGQRKTQAHHANTMRLNFVETYGRVEARDVTTGKALPNAYVKVYARLQNGAVRFSKDGYTDLRGRFDYASLNSPSGPGTPQPLSGEDTPANGLDYQSLRPGELDSIQKLSVLVLSDSHGAYVRELKPPGE